MRLRVTALAAVMAVGAIVLGAGCGSSNDNDTGTSGGTLTAASFTRPAGSLHREPGPGGRQEQR